MSKDFLTESDLRLLPVGTRVRSARILRTFTKILPEMLQEDLSGSIFSLPGVHMAYSPIELVSLPTPNPEPAGISQEDLDYVRESILGSGV